ncbi:MAG: M48 family metalloprotease [Acidobacteria bacterium]|nr:M48 family metalloprotease [Acidobacteriota bacterium]
MNPILHTLGWTLLHFLWQGLLLGLLASGAMALLQRRGPGLRYGVGLAFLGLMALAPIATFLILMPGADSAAPSPTAALAVAPQGALPWMLRLKLALDPGLPFILGAWLAGVGLLSLRFAGGLFYLQRLTSMGVEPAPAEWHLVVARLTREMGLSRAVRLLRSVRVEAPMVVGWMRPVILVPAAAFMGLSPAQIEAVLAHEMAHIRRYDFLVNLVQSALETLLFFHPAVWWLSSRLRAERELCCDDTAVAFCGDRAAYARALATLEGLRLHSSAELDNPLKVGADGGSLMNRIRRLLQPQLAPNPRFRSAALALAAAGLIAGTVVQQPTPKPPPEQKKEARQVTFSREGEVKINPDAKQPVTVGKHGRFQLSETYGAVTRSYEVTAKDGAVYKVNGAQTPMDDAGRAWLKMMVAQAKRDEARGARMKMNSDRTRMLAERERMQAERTRMETAEVRTVVKDGKQHIIVVQGGQVLSDDAIDGPFVSLNDDDVEGNNLGKVVQNRIIEVPEVTTVEQDGKMHVIVKRGGKVTEDRIMAPQGHDWQQQEGARRHALSAEQRAQMEKLRAQMEQLRRQMRELEQQAGQDRGIPDPPAPPEAPTAPQVAPPPPPPPPASPLPPAPPPAPPAPEAH